MEYVKEPANAVYQSGAKNPFLPLNIYIPDGEPKVFDGRVYLYGSKDEFDGEYCCHKFHVYSASVSDLTEWTDHGPVLASTDEYENEGIKKGVPWSNGLLWAPDVTKRGEWYYFYFCLSDGTEGVAKSKNPYGPFEDAVQITMGGKPIEGIDPSVLEDNGKYYYTWGQGHCHMAELNDDMCTLNPDTYEEALINKDDDGHGFHEASSLRKVGDHYVIVYASEFIDETHRNGGHPTNLDYAVSKSVTGPYVRKGRIIDNTGIDPQSWNNHGSIVKIENQWYVFYHGSSNNTKYARRARVERIEVDEERGIIEQVEMTSQGFSHGLDATAGIEAGWQCGLTGGAYLTEKEGRFPLVHITDGCSVKWRYIEFLEDANWTIEIEGTALKECGISILANGESVGVINIEDIHQETTWKAPIELNKGGRYEIELQFFAEGEEDLFELDRIRFVKNKIN
ncbi:MAG: family 43 glycosylhydrolase [Lachnospiraceae bacterium]